MKKAFLISAVFTGVLGAFGSTSVLAQQPAYPGYGYGPGMMGGYGMGMGQGMMGGYGMGMGPGMDGRNGLNLNDAQKAHLNKLQSKLRDTHRKQMDQMWEEHTKLNELYGAEKRDPAAIGKVYDRLSKLQREALEARIEAENKFYEQLTKEQKANYAGGAAPA